MAFNNLKHRLANPGMRELIVFGLLMTPVIWFGIWICAFSWIPPLEFILLGLLGLGVAASVTARSLDKRLIARFYKYSWTLVILLAACWGLWYPVRNELLAESKERGERISTRVAQFREENGACPESLDDPYFDDLSKWSSIGSKFSCSMEGECSVSFAGFGGYWWAYSAERKEWYAFD
ncbi:MAG: hypothetical protein KF797_11155 [Flavobacteriales bacterium]|nr:hypothetical protein [Flavobacteriales bacterium]